MTTELRQWYARSPDRLPDEVWHATVTRVRAEFAEMPCMRLTAGQARILLGLGEAPTRWVLTCLAREGFLEETSAGEFRRKPSV